jgi:poly(A) polymerase
LPFVPDPVVVARQGHPISRRQIDPDALKVLYRLNEHEYTAYLVGGSVRDLILGRRPKDFDIGTDAHPYQIKKLFRNCWIIGRRFRLAHIKFGQKTIEVATFRRNVPDVPPSEPPEEATLTAPEADPIHRDNTFGTPEEDAFRRDFTVNGLFYDVATRSVIDYVGGLDDLERRIIRSIGDPRVRFVEDPVRMLRAAVLGARLGFDLDALVIEAVAEHCELITTASPARLLEEYFKILRSGCAEASFRALDRLRLLELISPELGSPPDALWDSLARLDTYRQQFPDAPPELTNAVLISALLGPIGALERQRGAVAGRELRVTLGAMPVARRDLERLHQVMMIAPRLVEPELPPRLARTLPMRPAFTDTLTWLAVFGDAPEAVERWKHAHVPARHARPGGRHARPQRHHPPPGEQVDDGAPRPPRRRRRRRRRGRGRGPGTGGEGGGSAPA